MLTLLCNVKITRRQEMSYVVDGRRVLQWSGHEVYSAIEFILDKGQTHFTLESGDGEEKLLLTVRRA